MPDWMDQLIAEAERQGFSVRQTRQGAWMFRKGGHTFTVKATPRTVSEWTLLLDVLRAMGLDIDQPRR